VSGHLPRLLPYKGGEAEAEASDGPMGGMGCVGAIPQAEDLRLILPETNPHTATRVRSGQD
jgi:hypothetical protein